MPNGGSDCCGTCWFNRANGGQAGSSNHNHEIPSYCEIRELEIENPFYTYCANHPYNRSERDPIPIGPVYVGVFDPKALNQHRRDIWKPAPDEQEIREHLLRIVADPSQHERGYLLSSPSYVRAIEELLRLQESRLVGALEQLADDPRVADARDDILEMAAAVQERLADDAG